MYATLFDDGALQNDVENCSLFLRMEKYTAFHVMYSDTRLIQSSTLLLLNVCYN